MNSILASWRGNERLWKVFWIYNWLFGTAISLAFEAASKKLSDPALLVAAIPLLVWAIWVLVSLWRCAFNASWRGWGYIVRVLVVVVAIAMALSIFGVVSDEGVA